MAHRLMINMITPEFCGTSCHTDFYQQWKQAMMSQAYTHHWDEIEYFKLAVPHAEKDAEGCRSKSRLQRMPRTNFIFSWRCSATKTRNEFKSK
ncbi:MAG: hypothetical protein MZV64_06030 [Ignavibacteriales bacterium]|nr:hypothetical protein [Ignavibacteriales bacterium]